MHIEVEGSATEPKTGDRKTTTRCMIVFVAIDAGGDTVPLTAWQPESEDDKRLECYAVRMAAARKNDEDEILALTPP